MRNVVLRGILPGLALSLVLVTSGIGAVPASAHAALVGTDPKDGATLAVAPSTVSLTFNENIGHPQLAVRAPDGSAVKVTATRAVDNTLTGTVADVDQRGRYALSYRVVSADGHPVSGTVGYSVTAGRTVEQVSQPASESFIHRHSAHFFWGILAAVVAIVLLLAPLRRRDDADGA